MSVNENDDEFDFDFEDDEVEEFVVEEAEVFGRDPVNDLTGVLSGRLAGEGLAKVGVWLTEWAVTSPKGTAWVVVLGSLVPLFGLRPDFLSGLGSAVMALGRALQAVALAAGG